MKSGGDGLKPASKPALKWPIDWNLPMAVSIKGSRRFDDGGSNELFEPVLDAFDVLGDPKKRADYDGKPGVDMSAAEDYTRGEFALLHEAGIA